MLFVLAGAVVAIGALVQGAAGFGLALVAAPLLALVDPVLVPVPLLMVVTVHALLALYREHSDTDWHGVGWALLGRLPGIAIGVLTVATLPPRGFAVVVALSVLVCSLLSVLRWRPRPTIPALVAAGLFSGAAGTATSIGGPPVALLYQDAAGPRVRATLAGYFTAGALLSLAGLAVAGQITGPAVTAGLYLLPFMIAGFVASSPLRRFLDRGRTRPVVVGLAAASALVLLVRALSV
ncbi:sulfite exporter TauE/SafE family protein [Pseudonocardia bannensis]|uniref:sulfite exporter TauE/SafE family protein n=1 Tax=Pseudonocardia bannensis TaxID=630973 RepID=UPI0028A7432F|nr:sulfite exporter TauE/SafE family protein [Pseudonocardia bannensis]